MPFAKTSFFYFLFMVLTSFLWLGGCATAPPQSTVRGGERGEISVGVGGELPPGSPDESPAEARERRTRWIDHMLGRLSLEDRIRQMVMVRAYGYYYSAESDEFQRIQRLVKEKKYGGVIFFQGDVYETAVMANRLQALADLPLLVSADFEWGAAMRIRRTTRFPEAMALGATRDTMLAYEMGKAIAEEARAIGIHQVYAPVADVNNNPDNPVINTRSFGEDPELVAQMATAVALGLQAGGTLATAKHFPGHGDMHVDSHIGLPGVDYSRSRMDSIELVPFKRLIDRGVGSVMVAHAEYTGLPQKRVLPASISPALSRDLLQTELGFKGLVVSDALEMGALINTYGSDSIAVLAIEAGEDVLLLTPDEDAAVKAVLRAVRSGRITEERINTSVGKILGLKWDLGLINQRSVDLDKISKIVGKRSHLQLAKTIARRAVTIAANDGILPIRNSRKTRILNVIVSDIENYRTEINRTNTPWPNEAVGDYYVSQMRKRASSMETVRITPASDSLDFLNVVRKIKNADLVLLPVFSKARSGSGKLGLEPRMLAFIDSVLKAGKPTVALSMGNPYVLRGIRGASAYVCSYSDAEVMTEAVVEALFGEIPVRGKLPITIPDIAPFGGGIDLAQSTLRRDAPEFAGFNRDSLALVDSLLQASLLDSAFPDAQIVIVKEGVLAYEKSSGRQLYIPESPAITPATIFDLASLTKVIATTPAIMKLYDEGKLTLDDYVARYIPEFGNNGKDSIRLYNLLVHNAGLPAFKRFFLTCSTAQQALDSVYTTGMIYRTGDSTVYSDFDFILLGKIVEVITGVPLDVYVDSVFYAPLGMERTMFLPPESLRAQVAPTEYDSLWRKQLVRGIVHDENADLLGGVSGHAGLFSTASDLAIFMQMLMNGGSYEGRQYLSPSTIKSFTTKQSTASTRALGWDTKTVNGYSSAGTLFSASSFGHTGYTGTSVWADPVRNLFVILLTNRVHPTRANTKILKVRPVLHDAVVHALAPTSPG